MITKTDYEWLVNDCITSVERLLRIAPDIHQFLTSDYIDRAFTERYAEKDLHKLYLNTIEGICNHLIYLENLDVEKYDPDVNVLWAIMDLTRNLGDIRLDTEEMMTEENFHREVNLLSNEPSNIWHDINDIKNGFNL